MSIKVQASFSAGRSSNLTVSSLQCCVQRPAHRAFNSAVWKLLALRSSSLSWVNSVLRAAASASKQFPLRLHLCNLNKEKEKKI